MSMEEGTKEVICIVKAPRRMGLATRAITSEALKTLKSLEALPALLILRLAPCKFLRVIAHAAVKCGMAKLVVELTLLSVAYLLILYMIGRRTELNATALLIGGALGLTVLLTFFTFRLTRGKDAQRKE